MNCQHETYRQDSSRIIDLYYRSWVCGYSRIMISLSHQIQKFRQSHATFSDIVTNSLHRDSEKKGFCNRCKKYAPITSRPEVRTVPPILILNTSLDNNAEARRLWGSPDWLPTEIAVVPQGRSFSCFQGEILQDLLRAKPEAHNMVYELVGFVADINSGEQQKSHLVSLVNGKFWSGTFRRLR